MENEQGNMNPQQNPRRRRRSAGKVFLEAYLPVIIFITIVVLIVVFIVRAQNAKKERSQAAAESSSAAEESRKAQDRLHRQEADELLVQAQALACTYDYEGAIALLDSFSGNIFDYDDLLQLRDSYIEILDNLVEHSGEDVVNLSIQVLIADADRAFADPNYGNSYKKNFLTTEEFSNLLQALYHNGYVLVDMDDLVSVARDEAGNTAYTAKTVSLPQGKKPLMLTQTQVNYYSYMVDPDGDGIADKNGAGFASRLILDGDTFVNEMVDANGDTITGNFDLVPILEEFIAANPDFSYRGARPILALTGYNGIFGYRGDSLSDAVPVVQALRDRGYTLAFYTYNNSDYNASTADQIRKEAEKWNEKIVPVLGETDYMVYARSADIEKPGPYSSDKFTTLQGQGFRYYLGFCNDGQPWFLVETTYVRQGRIMVSASNLQDNPQWYDSIFDPSAILIEQR